jgi:deoxyadenosine/deoxycytidine kinase
MLSGRGEAISKANDVPLLLSVEAIIGAGKSTLLEELDSRSDIVVVREPVELWQQQRGGESLLSRYYGDQKANAFMFETYAMMSRVKALKQALPSVTPQTRAIVMERSWLSSRHSFAANSKDLGHLDDLQDSLHEDLFNWGLESWPSLDGVVFIDLPVAVAQSRVAKRGRTSESTIPSDYQEALMAKHRQWLLGDGANKFKGPVLVLDGKGDKSDGAISNMVTRVAEFVDRLRSAEQPTTVASQKDMSKTDFFGDNDKENLAINVVVKTYSKSNDRSNAESYADTACSEFDVGRMATDGLTYLTPDKSASLKRKAAVVGV